MSDKLRKIDATSLPYRACAGQMVINADGLVWVGRRADSKQDAEGRGTWWQMPQGGIDKGEDPADAARRELFEETAIRSVEQIGEMPRWVVYDLPPNLLGVAWGGRYRGQKQRWFAYRFLGSDSEINIVPPPGLEAEFVEWRWAPVNELLDLIVPFKREVYREVIAEFAPLARPLGT
ncbi:RNA pyrophosphohydrolase [Hyphomicrobium methylovorum]|uniref:RNA pyrophosphohydrolase n=1 Tax=Hyphomicrobium methylovorum TaxID=84 RepID=UPI0015E75942|nr:RNA pyrophosphohydrolase [Hyphomicrobium methylovorum]MBA2126305.1 RNA pyrophosphohydrolase [Hyphomicrobium methylovorum]